MLDFQSGETLLIDKPLGWTSFDVVNKIRWNIKQKLKIKNIKVGHAGTLDPLATGLLIICTGKHTKHITALIGQEKEYTGTIFLGKTTPSYDLETEYDQSYSVANISLDQIETVRQSFMGEQDQLPPLFSAKKIDGKRAYDYVREGKTVILNPNKIIITSFAIQTQNFPEIHFKISCSKGTYIRSIAHDFGKKLGIGATLTNLRRIKSGDFLIEEAMSVEEWVAKITLGE
jgi:tRNA pseudouridine55 synthase